MVRQVKRKTGPDGRPLNATDVVATVHRRGREPAIVLIVLYRPPVDAWTVELPAGLVDPGESATQAAERELLEETGFTAKTSRAVLGGREVYPDPWKSSESYRLCEIEVDGDATCNLRPEPRHESDEHFAAVLLVPLSSLGGVLEMLSGEPYNCLLEPHSVGLAHGVALARAAL